MPCSTKETWDYNVQRHNTVRHVLKNSFFFHSSPQPAGRPHLRASSRSGCRSPSVSPSWLGPEWWCERSAGTESWPGLRYNDGPLGFREGSENIVLCRLWNQEGHKSERHGYCTKWATFGTKN